MMKIIHYMDLQKEVATIYLQENYIFVSAVLLMLFPVYFIIKKLIAIFIKKLIKKIDSIMDKAAKDKKYKNRIASIIFFFSDMGPNISSFSIIALFITGDENMLTLTIVFFVGIIIKEASRELKHAFYADIAKRSK